MRWLVAAILLVAQEERLPIPSAAEQKKNESEIKAIFKEDLSKRDRDSKKTLSQKLLDQAMDARNTSASRYVLLFLARDLAAEGMEVATGFSAIQHLDKLYEMGKPPLTGATFSSNLNAQKAAFLNAAKKYAGSPDDQLLLARAYLELAESALTRFEFDDAQVAVDQAARLSKDPDVSSQITAFAKEIPLRKQEDAAVKKAELTLAASSEDPEANLTIGRYLLFVKVDEPNGLAALAKTSDTGLKDVAKRELAKPISPEDMAAVGEAWVTVATRERSPLHKRRFHDRGVRWLNQALDLAGGLTKAKIEKRLKELNPVALDARAITFTSPDRLRLFVTSGGTWKVQGGELIGSCPGGSEWATLKAHYSSITQIRIKGRIVPPAKTNFRIWAGPLRIIYNWELAEENHYWNYWNGRVRTATKPPLLTPGKESEIIIQQMGKKVVITVDGKKDYETEAVLAGTVSFQASLGSTMAIRELKVEGTIDAGKEVAPENRAEP